MMKYEPLSNHLEQQAGDEWRASFSDLETVLGFALPKLAHTSGAWWANEPLKPHNLAWIGPGWKVGEVDRKGQSVVFRRAPPKPVVSTDGPDAAAAKSKFGAAAMIAASVAVAAGLGAVALRTFGRRRPGTRA